MSPKPIHLINNVATSLEIPWLIGTCKFGYQRWWLISRLEIIALSGVVYKVQSSGPSTEPRGIPYGSATSWIATYFFKKEEKQIWGCPDIPYQYVSLFVNIAWSMVSKAADKLSSVRAVTSPLSILTMMSLCTLSGVYEVADYITYTFCKILEVKLKLDTRLYFFSLFLVRDVFNRWSYMRICEILKKCTTSIEMLILWVMGVLSRPTCMSNNCSAGL